MQLNANMNGQQFEHEVQEFVSDDDQYGDEGEQDATASDLEQEDDEQSTPGNANGQLPT